MGLTVYYQSTEPVSEWIANPLKDLAKELCSSRSWASCEPVSFSANDDSGRVCGGSKMEFSAGLKEVGDGPLLDLLHVLCELSKKFGLDWELMLEDDDQPLGVINKGIAEPQLLSVIESIAGLGEVLDWANSEELYDIDELQGNDDFEGEVPKIVKFRPID